MSQLVESQRTFPFRRRLFVARHRKRSVWLRLWKPLVKALLVVGVPTALGLWVLTAPQFTLQNVTIRGTEQIEGSWVQQRLATYQGRPLVSMPMAAVEARVSSHPWVAAVQVNKQLPSQLEVEIQEQVPWAVVRSGEGADFVDQQGHRFAPFSSTARWANLPLIEGTEEVDVLARAVAVVKQLGTVNPNWGAKVSRVEALNDWDFRIETHALPFALTVNANSVEDAIRSLSTHLGQIQREFSQIQAVDLRVSGSIVVQPETQQEE